MQLSSRPQTGRWRALHRQRYSGWAVVFDRLTHLQSRSFVIGGPTGTLKPAPVAERVVTRDWLRVLMEHVSGTAYSKTNFDGLTAFLKHVRQNQDAFVETYPEAMRLLAEVEGLFQRFRSVLKPPQTVPLVVLAVRCHSLYVTAASAAMAGSTMEVQPLLRAALECSGYAAHLRFNPELEDIWVARADRTDQAARKGVRAHFKHTKICETVDKVGTEVGQSYRTMYDAAIDLGAHPNVIGVMSSFDVQEREYERSIEHHILTADMRKVLHTAALVGQVGMLCVYIMRSVFPAVVPELTDEDFVSPVTLIARLGATIAA